MPKFPVVVKDAFVVTVLCASWAFYWVMSSTLGTIDHYEDPPEDALAHRDLLIVHSTTVLILQLWTRVSTIFGLLYCIEV